MLHSRWNGDGKDVYNKNEYLIEPCVLTALSVQSPTVFRWRSTLLLLEHPTEMLGIFEAEAVGDLGDGPFLASWMTNWRMWLLAASPVVFLMTFFTTFLDVSCL